MLLNHIKKISVPVIFFLLHFVFSLKLIFFCLSGHAYAYAHDIWLIYDGIFGYLCLPVLCWFLSFLSIAKMSKYIPTRAYNIHTHKCKKKLPINFHRISFCLCISSCVTLASCCKASSKRRCSLHRLELIYAVNLFFNFGLVSSWLFRLPSLSFVFILFYCVIVMYKHYT